MNNRIKRIVKEVIEDIVKNDSEGKYASTLQDEELTEGVTYLYAKNTGLPFDIIVDCGRTYEYYGHPLCLYIVNGDNVIPINITKNIKHSSECPIEIAMFIQDNYNALCAFANMEIDGPDFFDIIKDYKYKLDAFNDTELIAEMSNYGPAKTGLPIWVYIDDTISYQKSGHNGSYRIKFQQDKDITNPRLWMPLAIPSLEIMDNGKLPPIKIPKKHINIVIFWTKGNLQLLEDLRDGIIDGTQFKEQMKTVEDIKVIVDSETKNN